ncbi:uncharacterized protein Dwil_GK16735 [Drosophila willistoni]|uniref:Uncharacterized protein n=1 Tax=Drosophila willistoni TaxID=7260 RepID=B4MME7_DROWI|nr:chorion protein S19 [Drosophila willistoni]EDW73292.1 uncharacterized protein Dwil_GK16735 [Drosophila willistoni]
MNKFATLAVFICAYLAVGSCYGGGHGGYGGPIGGPIGGYGGNDGGAASAASSSAAAAGGNEQRPVEIIAGGPRGGYGGGYGGNHHGHHEILRPIRLEGGYGGERLGHGYGGERQGPHGGYGQRHGGYGRPRWTVQPAGATLLYPGQNNYRAYVSPPEYSKVILPIRPAAPVAKLFVPENNYNNAGYGVEGPKY